MRAKTAWTFKSFITCFFWNGILITVMCFAAIRVLDGIHLWIDPYLQQGAPSLPEGAQSALVHLGNFIGEIQRYLLLAVVGYGALVTFLLWLCVLIQGRGLVKRSQAEGVPRKVDLTEVAKENTQGSGPSESQYVQPSPQAAVQILSILQREGRLMDFLQEDLSLYEDVQIGAAVRSIHQGCKEALTEYVDLKPIYEESEGVEVTVPPGFDSKAIRLTGNVTGDPPFKGILRHRGWQASRIELPRPISEQKKDWIVAPAEVEVT